MAAKATSYDFFIYLKPKRGGGGVIDMTHILIWLSRDQKKIKWKIDTSFWLVVVTHKTFGQDCS